MIKLRAYAKLNLSLNVTGKHPDGYHDIDSVMQSISLHDEVDIIVADSGIKVKCSIPGIEDNIAQKAAELLFAEAKVKGGVSIHIKKNIPLSAGLGGGSADAAATTNGGGLAPAQILEARSSSSTPGSPIATSSTGMRQGGYNEVRR